MGFNLGRSVKSLMQLASANVAVKLLGVLMIAFFARHYPQSYLGDTVEAAATAARHGMTIREVPSRMRMAESSSITSFIGIFHTLRTCMAILIDRLERPLPMGGPDGQGDDSDKDDAS